MAAADVMEKWNVAKSAELYGVDNWGGGFFGINQAGHVCVFPERSPQPELDLFHLVQSLKGRGIELPLLIRFDGIIRTRVRQVQNAFDVAIKDFNYGGRYHLTYPVKVNQQRHVVDSVRVAGQASRIGLEVGSKPELLAVLAVHDAPEGLLLCNGYKDTQYIELALLARQLGRRAIIIVEQLYEVETILKVSQELGIEPEIGVRMKPASRGGGRWGESAGEGAKFGLYTHEIVQMIEILKRHDKIAWLKLLHFHIGSQIPSISAIKRVLAEAARMYAELKRSCPELSFIDVGGGLGVDYDGSRTNFQSSVNYSLEEYARDVVWEVMSVCEQEKLPHPDLISESGRAVVAHHSLLVTEVMDVAPVLDTPEEIGPPPTSHETLAEIHGLLNELSVKSCLENLHDALELKERVLQRFLQGDISIEERAYADRTLKCVFARIIVLASTLKYVPEDLVRLEEKLSDTYFCNFSLFQSLPDSWAVDQLFPLMPIHELHQEPTRRAIVADVTCDSDGKISRFIDLKGVNKYVLLHPYREENPYYLGIFMVGAYQEILGDLHNLFGDTNAVHVDVGPGGEIEIASLIEGDTVREVLSYVQFDSADLLNRLRLSIEKALREGKLSFEDSVKLQKRYKEALEGYTYLLR